MNYHKTVPVKLTRIIQSLYYAPAGRYTSDNADRGRSIIRAKAKLNKRQISFRLKAYKYELP